MIIGDKISKFNDNIEPRGQFFKRVFEPKGKSYCLANVGA
jgi:hypothetical protein